MSEVSEVSVSETCRCGGSTTVTGMGETDTLRAIEAWRSAHPCAAADQKDKTGAPSAVIGFGADLGRNWYGRRPRPVDA